jgi:NAD(P)-dependent dehydrogenase (short-subunit alcohol dehydrogenase family)
MSISFRLDDKLILVTGASSGIGQSIAIESAQAGARVVLLGRNEDRLAETVAQCDGRGIACPFDLTHDLDAIPKFVRGLAKEHGPFSGIVHSAGVYKNIPLRAINSKMILDMLSLNSLAGVMLAKGLSIRGCSAEEGASLVLLSSVMGHVGQPGLLGYSMSKGAVEQAVKSLSLELQSDAIRVNSIAPASIHTPMTDQGFASLDDDLQKNIMAMHPGGFGQPKDIAAAAIYLLSDASKFVTGTSLLVDGGYCAQ